MIIRQTFPLGMKMSLELLMTFPQRNVKLKLFLCKFCPSTIAKQKEKERGKHKEAIKMDAAELRTEKFSFQKFQECETWRKER